MNREKGLSMKKLGIVMSLCLLCMVYGGVSPIHAQMGSMMGLDAQESQDTTTEEHADSVETVLQSMLQKQNVATVQELNLSVVSDDEWERLGDAVMELQHPREAHEVMDTMMGGEGSESLRQMHINMGKAYLGFGSSAYGPGTMMGTGMMGYNNSRSYPTAGKVGFGGMMGYGNYHGYGILPTLTWILAMVFLASGTYYFLKQANKK